MHNTSNYHTPYSMKKWVSTLKWYKSLDKHLIAVYGTKDRWKIRHENTNDSDMEVTSTGYKRRYERFFYEKFLID